MRNGAVPLVAALAAVTIPLAARQQPPTFQAATDIVEVDVVVLDNQGRFVTDLTRPDFDVREEGNPERIDVFYFVAAQPATADASLPLAFGTTSPGAQTTPARKPPIYVTFFDQGHLTPEGFKRVQAAALSLFEKQFRNGDVGGVVVGERLANNRLTTDSKELLKAVRDAKASAKASSHAFDERAWPRLTQVEAIRMIIHGDNVVLQEAIRRACIDDPNACQTKIDVEGLIRQKATMLADTVRAETASTLRSLIALMNGLARIDGRKTVFFLTEGFLAEQSWPFVEQAVGLAARANARIYTLDARGLDRSGMADHLAGANPSGDDGMLNLLKQFDMGIDSVNSLAVDSGGFVVRNHNYFDKAVEQIVAEAGTYYVLGYRPTKAPDGKFRRLSVHVARPGLVVRARRGYMATPREATTTPAAAVPPSPIPFPVPVAEATAAPMAPPAAPGAPEPSAVTGGAAPAAAATSVPSRSSLRFRPDALAHVETLGQNSPADTDATAGWAAYQRGDLESARVSLAAAARRGSARPWVFYALGQSQYALRQYQDAAGAWEQVRSTTPEFKPVYFDLVDAYLQLKDYDKATRVLRDGETRWQRDPERLNALGVVQVARGSLDDAVQSFEQAIAAAPAEGTAYFNLGKACELRYLKNRRFIRQTGQWMANGNDRNKAIASYTRYLEIGGAFENSARDGLSRLGWVEK